jgi:hypothetical protein
MARRCGRSETGSQKCFFVKYATCGLRISLYGARPLTFATVQFMSAATERRIDRLSAEALTAKTAEDIDRILEELRAALQEHVRLAKNNLRSQANSLA